MKKSVTAIFDIGKTNKKFFLFDSDYREVYREYTRFDEIEDEDGFPTENLEALSTWCKEVFESKLLSPEYDIKALNFSTYGASLVHIDEQGNPLTPLYNYLKPIDKNISTAFYNTYGPEDEISKTTGSLKSGMLNTGMQLFWLKKTKSKLFKKIKYSMHLPQYLSFLFTGVATSEYTNIGCHTMLWDFENKDYHHWVYDEAIHKILPPVLSATISIPTSFNGKTVAVGIGIHDSSAALLPYIRTVSKPFILISTGTWSISINPFMQDPLTIEDIQRDCIYNMRVDGSPIRASRLFLGNEYKLQVAYLSKKFGVASGIHMGIKFDPDTFADLMKDFNYMFRWEGIVDENMPTATKVDLGNFESAYHQLMLELVLLQVKSLKMAMGTTRVNRLYIDGGFSDNEVYIKLLSHFLKPMKIRTTDASLGTALGAAMVISGERPGPGFLKKIYALKKHIPLKLG